MSITKRGSSYEAAVNHKGSRYRRSFKDQLEAEIWEAQAKADLVAGRVPELSNQAVNRGLPRTLDELADYTYRTVWSGTKGEGTAMKNSNSVVNTIGPKVKIQDIDKMTVDICISEFKKIGNSNGTINRKMSALSKMLGVAEELEIIDRKPKWKRLKEPVGRIRWYTDEEQLRIMRMFNHLGYPEYGDIVRVLLDTGMRCGELFGLEWEDIQGNLIVLDETKNGSPRSIPMTVETSRIINDQDCDGGPFKWTNHDRLYRLWQQVRFQLGWIDDDEATLHTCRHTFISNLVQEGVPIAMVQRLAGHKTISMTMRYTHLAPKDLESAIERLEGRRGNVVNLPIQTVA